MPLFARLSIALAALLLVGCATYTEVRQHQNFQQHASEIETVVILPPDVAVELVTFTGENEALTDKQTTLAAELVKVVGAELKQDGLNVIEFDFAKAIETNQDLAFALTQCKEAYAKVKGGLYEKPVETKNLDKFTASIDHFGNAVAEATGADALVVVEYNGFEKSGGMIAKDIAAGVLIAALTGAMPISPKEGAVVEIALISTSSGDVLWTNRKGNPQLNTAVAGMALKDLPDMKWLGEIKPAVAAPIAAIEPQATVDQPQPEAAPADDTATTTAAVAKDAAADTASE